MGRTRAAEAVARPGAEGCAASCGALPPCDPVPAHLDDALTSGREALLQEVVRLNGGAVPTPPALAEAKQRLSALATCADATGVSFAGAALHYAYFDTKYALRASLVYQLLSLVQKEHPEALAALLADTITATHPVRVASLGGGPGTDAAGVCAFMARHGQRVECTLYDLERSWRRYCACLQRLVGQDATVAFAPCDVRAGLAPCSAPDGSSQEADGLVFNANKQLATSAPETALFIFSFVANETARAARATGWDFYRDLAVAAPESALFIFLDVRRASAPVLDAICAAMAEALGGRGRVRELALSRSVAAETRVLVKESS
jgi:hypothetical protein